MIVLINSTQALQHFYVISGIKYLKKVANISLNDKTVSSDSCGDHCSFLWDSYSHGALKIRLCRKYQTVQTTEGKRCSDYYYKLWGITKVLTAIPNFIYIYIGVIRKF
jgi:hypothetical protein